ncbi:MAG: hypothetical protein IT340_02565 [Chloroflexi bacterium]|nr:hypothetical protein [Chloroflexota bacterium]
MHEERAWQRGDDRIAKTLVKELDLRIVLIALRASGRIADHRAAGPISIQTLTGQLRLRLPGNVMDLPAGRLVSLERDVPHEVEAIEDSAFLLTIAWPDAQVGAAD